MNISEIRAKYPQYDDLSDEQLAKGFHNKFYSYMDYNEFAKKIGLKNTPEPMTEQQKLQAEMIAQETRPEKTLGDKIADAMVTTPLGRGVGFVLQGISNAGLNPAGYIARAAGLDTKPLEAQTSGERISELAGQYGFDTAALTTGITGLAKAGVGGSSLGGNVIKALAEGGQPVAQAGSLGSAAVTGFINPKTDEGRFATDVAGGLLANPILRVGNIADKATRSLSPLGRLAKAKYDINSLTFDPEKSTLSNIGKKITGKGQTIDDVLNQENQRLARKSIKDDKIINARKTNQQAYDMERVLRGNDRGQVELGATWSPNEVTQKSTGNNLSFNEYAPSIDNGNRFYQAMSAFKKKAGKVGEQVYQYTPEEYANMRTFLSKDGKTGFAIKEDGDIVSVFNGGEVKGAGDNIIQAATSAGGTKLDAFDTFLPEVYSRNGFKVNERDVWNEQYKPSGWDKGFMRRFNQGQPDVVYMNYDPNYYGIYESPNKLQNVVDRINASKDSASKELKDIWTKDKGRTFNTKKALDAMQTKDGERKIARAIKSGAEDLSQDIRELDARIKYHDAGAPDAELDKLFELEEMAKAKNDYSTFINANADKSIPKKVMQEYYQQNPLAKPYLENARAVNPSEYNGLKPNGIVENDKLKQGMRVKRTKDVDTIGNPTAGGYENAENALKNLMEKYYPKFKDVNTEYAQASTKQGIYDNKAKSGISRLSNVTENEILSALVNTLVSGGAMGALAFNKAVASIPLATGASVGLLRKYFRNAGRNLVYDKSSRMPEYLSELARVVARKEVDKTEKEK